ncbi:aminotransferase-like domain-containing protein [Cupriavidus basilensis]
MAARKPSTLPLRAVARPGDVIAVESPTYYGLLQILESLGMRALEIPSSPQTGISLEAAGTGGTNLRQHPRRGGGAKPAESAGAASCRTPTRRNWWHGAEQRAIALIEDDCFSALADSDAPLAALKAWDRGGGVIHCASLHKILAPGMRLGWIAAGKWQARVEMLKYSQSRPNELLAQIAAAEYMGSGAFERHLRRLREQLRSQRGQVAQAIAAEFPAGTRASNPNGGLHLWVELPGSVSSETVFDQAMEAGIRVVPGVMFSNSNRFDHFLRLNCGTPYSPAIERALRTLAGVVARVADKPGPQGGAGARRRRLRPPATAGAGQSGLERSIRRPAPPFTPPIAPFIAAS